MGQDPIRDYRDSVTIEGNEWDLGGFNNVMMATFQIKNAGSQNVKDVEISCVLSAQSGTVVSRPSKTILQIFPAGRTTTLRDQNMGFANSQSDRAACSIRNFAF